MKTTLPPGMLDRSVEFFIDSHQLKVITGGKMHSFNDAPLSVYDMLAEAMTEEAENCLDKMGIMDPIARLEKFARCNFGDYDARADLTQDGVKMTEYYDCGNRGNCPFEGKLCQGLKAMNGMITPREVEYLRLVMQDMPDKMIAEEMGCSVYTVCQHRRNIQAKTETHSKAGLAVWAMERGVR